MSRSAGRPCSLRPGRQAVDLGPLPVGSYAVRADHRVGAAATAFDVPGRPPVPPSLRVPRRLRRGPDRRRERCPTRCGPSTSTSSSSTTGCTGTPSWCRPPTSSSTRSAGRLSLATVRRLVATVHEIGGAALGYAAVYGAGEEYASAHPDEVLHHRDGSPWMLADFLWIMDVTPGSAWSRHIVAAMRRAVTEVGFDGLHLDQYGHPKTALTAAGERVDLGGRVPRPHRRRARLAAVVDADLQQRQRLPDPADGRGPPGRDLHRGLVAERRLRRPRPPRRGRPRPGAHPPGHPRGLPRAVRDGRRRGGGGDGAARAGHGVGGRRPVPAVRRGRRGPRRPLLPALRHPGRGGGADPAVVHRLPVANGDLLFASESGETSASMVDGVNEDVERHRGTRQPCDRRRAGSGCARAGSAGGWSCSSSTTAASRTAGGTAAGRSSAPASGLTLRVRVVDPEPRACGSGIRSEGPTCTSSDTLRRRREDADGIDGDGAATSRPGPCSSSTA